MSGAEQSEEDLTRFDIDELRRIADKIVKSQTAKEDADKLRKLADKLASRKISPVQIAEPQPGTRFERPKVPKRSRS